MYNSTQSLDVRMLVLKRWNQAQTGDLFDETVGRRGQYISFQSYHFIDIYSSAEEPALLRTYEQLRDTKNVSVERTESTSNNGFFHDTHIVQSMMLLGENDDFWGSEAETMSIPFIQLVDSTNWVFEEIKQQLSGKIPVNTEQEDGQDQVNWALYYSLDFCDLVLFTKRLKMKSLHDLLWEMTQSDVIRDTFTINCFGYTFLKNYFEEKQQGTHYASSFVWDDELALSMNFSVRDMSVLPALSKVVSKTLKTEVHLQSNGKRTKQFWENRLSGRYDFRITTDMLKGDLILQLFCQINSLFHRQKDKPTAPFYGYEIALLIAPNDRRIPQKRTKSNSTKFENRIGIILEKLYDACISIKQPFMDYTTETLRALYELNRSGFSEEFVLSLLPSFSAFIELMRQATVFQMEAQPGSEYDKIAESILQMQQSYFSALNTLSLCTMHSERQFIHAPAFNASYFEIPPKTLAFYSAVTDHIASLLAESEKKKYYYLITPDFRSDIYVRPLNIHYKRDSTKHLAIINLPEKYFYQPEKAFMLLAHEVGHYEGNREREERAKCIFEMVGLLLLQYTMLNSCNQETIPQTARLFAREFGDYLFEKYQDDGVECVREIRALLDDIARFLDDVHHGLDFFTLEKDSEAVAQRWSKALYEKRKDAKIQRECSFLLKKIDDRMHTDYLASLAKESVFAGACDVITRSIINQLSSLQSQSRREEYQDIVYTSESITQAFSEAFADKQMLAVMGEQFNSGDYVELLKSGNKDEDISTAEQRLRFNAIRRIEQSIPLDDYFAIESSFQETVVESIVSYLHFTGESKTKETTDWCKRKWEQEYLGESNWIARCKIICNMLDSYKKRPVFKVSTLCN